MSFQYSESSLAGMPKRKAEDVEVWIGDGPRDEELLPKFGCTYPCKCWLGISTACLFWVLVLDLKYHEAWNGDVWLEWGCCAFSAKIASTRPGEALRFSQEKKRPPITVMINPSANFSWIFAEKTGAGETQKLYGLGPLGGGRMDSRTDDPRGHWKPLVQRK